MAILDTIIFIVWLAFWTYWIFSAANTKRTIMSGAHVGIAIRLGIIIILLLSLELIKGSHSSNLAHYHLSGLARVLTATIGSILIATGLSFAVWARVHIGKNWGTPMSQKENPELVTSGPYKYVRHPIYTGIITASLGTAVAVGIFWYLLFIMFSIYFIYSAFHEEKYLTKEFGKLFIEYKKRSKMIIPFVY